MSDYLATLAARECGPPPPGGLRPRLASLFESVPINAEGLLATPPPIEVSAPEHAPVHVDGSKIPNSASAEKLSDSKPALTRPTEPQNRVPEPALSEASTHGEVSSEGPGETSSIPMASKPIIEESEAIRLNAEPISRPRHRGSQSAEEENPSALVDTTVSISSPKATGGSNRLRGNVVGSPATRNHSRLDVAQNSQAPTAPKIQVTIGRVEVRAILPPATSRPVPKPAAKKVSLEDYLKGNGGRP